MYFLDQGYKTYELEGTVSEEQPCTYCVINATIKMKMNPGEKRPDRPLVIEIAITSNNTQEDNQRLFGNFRFLHSARLKGILLMNIVKCSAS